MQSATFRLLKSFYQGKTPLLTDFSTPVLIAGGDDDMAYETNPLKRALIIGAKKLLFADPIFPTDEQTPHPSPSKLSFFGSDATTCQNSDTEEFLGDGEEVDAVSPLNDAPKIMYQRHKRNQSSLSLVESYSDVFDYQLSRPNHNLAQSTSTTLSQPISYHVKMVVVGDGGCGKTCLLVSYSQGIFPTEYVPTVFENYVAQVQTPNEEVVELALWDTAGQEEYDRLRPLSYPESDIFLICYAMDNIDSLINVEKTWYPEVQHFCPGIPIILVGTKLDLYNVNFENRTDRKYARKVAKNIGAIAHVECSSRTMFNVKTVFNLALDKTLKGMSKKNKRLTKKIPKPKSPIKRSPPTFEYGQEVYFVNPKKEQITLRNGKPRKHKCVIL